MNGALAILLLAGSLASPGDTLIQVREGGQLILRDFGAVSLEGWDRSEVRAESEDKESTSFRVIRSGNQIELQVADGRGSDRGEEIRLRVPTWMDVEISGKNVEVSVRDLAGDVTVKNLRGDLVFQNLSGSVDAYTAQGSIEARDLAGSARLRSGDDDIVVNGSTGDLELETVGGDITLLGMASSQVSARTTDGEIEFSGHLSDGGEYGFFSHGGDMRIQLEPPVAVEARILAYGGEFRSDFPVRARGFRSGESMEFTLGGGGARLTVETFDGEIRLLRDSGVFDEVQLKLLEH